MDGPDKSLGRRGPIITTDCATHLLPLLRAIITSFRGRRWAHAVTAGVVRRRADQRGDEAEHAANDPLEHRPSLGDVARMCSRSRRGRLLAAVAAAGPRAPTSWTHGVGYLGERRAEAELRWGARARSRESEAAAGAVRAHFIDIALRSSLPRWRTGVRGEDAR